MGRLLPVLEPQHKIIRVPDDNHIAFRRLFAPVHYPLIEYVMQIDIGNLRRDHRSLWRPNLRLRPLPSSDTSAVSHFPISRSIRRSAIRIPPFLMRRSRGPEESDIDQSVRGLAVITGMDFPP